MSSRPSQIQKRLLKELQNNQKDPNEAVLRLGPVADDELLHWSTVMKGVAGTPYEDGLWLLDIKIPEQYPLVPPNINFVTPICHPNVHFKTGEICLDLLKTGWSPAYTINTTMRVVQQLLTSPEPDSPLNIDIALLYRQNDRAAADSLIRYYTETLRYDGQ